MSMIRAALSQDFLHGYSSRAEEPGILFWIVEIHRDFHPFSLCEEGWCNVNVCHWYVLETGLLKLQITITKILKQEAS